MQFLLQMTQETFTSLAPVVCGLVGAALHLLLLIIDIHDALTGEKNHCCDLTQHEICSMLNSSSYAFAFVVWSSLYVFFYFHIFFLLISVFVCCRCDLIRFVRRKEISRNIYIYLSYEQRSADFTRFIQVRTMCFVQIKCANELLIHAHFVL